MNNLNLNIDLDKLTKKEKNTFMELVKKTQQKGEWEEGDKIYYIRNNGEVLLDKYKKKISGGVL